MFYFQATVAQYRSEVMELQSALSDAKASRRDISQKLTKTKEEYRVKNEILWGAVSQIECALNNITQVKQEENAELTQLKGSTKLKENMETLRKKNAELKEDLEAQTVQVSHVGTLLH